MNSPRFQLLDVVALVAAGEDTPQGTVTQVRRYDDGRFTYVIAPLGPVDIATVFEERDLAPTDRRREASEFTTIGAFHIRDVVRVSTSSAHEEVAGKLGTVMRGGGSDADRVLVWVDDLEEVWMLPQEELEGTGERKAPERRTRTTSLGVSQSGDVRGSEDYEVLDDVAYL